MSGRVRLQRVERTSGESGWWPIRDGDYQRASVRCPECGFSAMLPHRVTVAGEVSPSVVCPQRGCGWHVYVTLDGWTGGDVPDCSGQ